MRLIDADALEKSIRAYADNKGCGCGQYELANGILKALSCVENAPTIDAAPVVHGQWEAIVNAYGEIEAWIHKDCGFSASAHYNYCPKCGAKMDGKESEDAN